MPSPLSYFKPAFSRFSHFSHFCRVFPQLRSRNVQPRRRTSNEHPGHHDNRVDGVRPLDGVRVLDLTRVLAGPFATMLLGDLGAEVIKVEKPGSGDDTRSWGPPFVGSQSVYFLSVNRNKKSIAVDMKHPRGAGVIRELARVSDVLVENFLPGKLSEFGLGPEQLREQNPQLIYCSISGYGQSGPSSLSPGYDSILSAVSGMMHITGPEVSCLSHIAANFLNSGQEAKRWGTAHGSIVPYQGFGTRDGHIVVAAGNDTQFVRVCQVLGLDELAHEPKYKTNKLRVQNRKQLLSVMSQRFAEETTSDWLRRFEGSGVPVGPINSIQQVFSDPQVKHNDLIQDLKHPTAGTIRVPGPAVRFSSFSPLSPAPPPLIGQHTVSVLTGSLHYSEQEVTSLLQSGAVAQSPDV
ncbi:succinate--hydroxymethylglutarate CoA-transferase isoform X3 [Boleophthalmus pectinirostris]|uniref:succinate--hydroxymethylglutarate CoA-transferase isoform X3 n=1 Tax=Boleophthalmus pectinirostris TaxID=150288 RepID=UPI000A1C3089|nr:succinate--hydroxymethylglutarate CoA-transferase isoform X3 [Boleophthalmus pectinirostris]